MSIMRWRARSHAHDGYIMSNTAGTYTSRVNVYVVPLLCSTVFFLRKQNNFATFAKVIHDRTITSYSQSFQISVHLLLWIPKCIVL